MEWRQVEVRPATLAVPRVTRGAAAAAEEEQRRAEAERLREEARMDRDAWATAVAGLSGGENVAIVNNGDPNSAYYIVKLDADPWYVVPEDGLRCDDVFGDDGEPLNFLPGERVLRGYFYSLRQSP